MSSTDLYLAAAGSVADTVEQIPAAAWAGPGLGVWDLRALVGHTSRSLVTVLTYLERPADQVAVATPEAYFAHLVTATFDQAAVAERGRDAGRALGAEPSVAFRALLSQVEARLSQADGDDVIETIAGGMRVSAYLPTRTFELVVHGLDIAAATGIACDFPLAVMSQACALGGRISAELGSGPVLLAALTGRAALPVGFSVV